MAAFTNWKTICKDKNSCMKLKIRLLLASALLNFCIINSRIVTKNPVIRIGALHNHSRHLLLRLLDKWRSVRHHLTINKTVEISHMHRQKDKVETASACHNSQRSFYDHSSTQLADIRQKENKKIEEKNVLTTSLSVMEDRSQILR